MKRYACRLTVALITFTLGLASGAWRTPRPTPVPQMRPGIFVKLERPGAPCNSAETRRRNDATLDKTNSAYALDMLGYDLRARGCFEEAATAYATAIAVDPTYVAAYNDLANTYNFLGWYEEARQTANKGLQVQRDNAFLANELGYACKGLGQYREAVQAFEQAAQAEPENAYTHATVSSAYFKLKRYDEAAATARRGATLGARKDDDAALGNAGLALANLGRYAEALNVLQQARGMAPNSSAKYLELGQVYELNGQPAEAQTNFAAALTPRPVTPFDYYNRAWAHLYLNEDAAAAATAREYLERVNWQGQDAPYVALLAYVAYRQNNEPGAADSIIDEAATRCNRAVWPQQLFRYVQHQRTAAALLAAAKTDDERLDAQTIIGLSLLLDGRPGEAQPYLQFVRANGLKSDLAYLYVVRQLTKLEAAATD